MRRIFTMSLLFSMLAGCGDGVAPGDSLPDERAREVCQDACASLIQCGEGDSLTECSLDCQDFARIARSDVMLELTACLQEAACLEQDACGETIANGPLTDAAQDMADRCQERMVECGVSSVGCVEGAHDFIIFNDEIVNGLTDCYDEPCDLIQSCQSGILEAAI
jgi:hypothetical protein